jgi:hypothetical protein
MNSIGYKKDHGMHAMGHKSVGTRQMGNKMYPESHTARSIPKHDNSNGIINESNSRESAREPITRNDYKSHINHSNIEKPRHLKNTL